MDSVLKEAETVINGDRAESYGSPLLSCSRISAIWTGILDTKVTPEQVCLCMIGLKLAREKNKHQRDNLVDIAGYAGVLENLLKQKEEVPIV